MKLQHIMKLQITVKQESRIKNAYPKFNVKIRDIRLEVVLLSYWLPARLAASPFPCMGVGRWTCMGVGPLRTMLHNRPLGCPCFLAI